MHTGTQSTDCKGTEEKTFAISQQNLGTKLMPVIGIVPSQNSTEKMVSVPQRYVRAITEAGGAPLLLPVSGNPHVYETLFSFIDGFVLTGGNDIDPARYGAIRDSGKISEHSPEREELEYLILSYAYRFDVPLLGICRGMQMINVCFGGTLYRDLEDQFGGVARKHINDEVKEMPHLQHWQKEDYGKPTHDVFIKADSQLRRLLEREHIMVNSMHHQGICDLSTIVDPVAYASDGLVEAIEVHNRNFMIGIQWHPEFFEDKQQSYMNRIFQALVKASYNRQQEKHEPVRIIQENEENISLTAQEKTQWPAITFADYI